MRQEFGDASNFSNLQENFRQWSHSSRPATLIKKNFIALFFVCMYVFICICVYVFMYVIYVFDIQYCYKVLLISYRKLSEVKFGPIITI